MDVKFTLKLDRTVIEKAKIYAAKQKVNLSFIVENYLKAITSMGKNVANEDVKISEFVKSISIGNGEIPADLDYKKEYYNHLLKKHK